MLSLPFAVVTAAAAMTLPRDPPRAARFGEVIASLFDPEAPQADGERQ